MIICVWQDAVIIPHLYSNMFYIYCEYICVCTSTCYMSWQHNKNTICQIKLESATLLSLCNCKWNLKSHTTFLMISIFIFMLWECCWASKLCDSIFAAHKPSVWEIKRVQSDINVRLTNTVFSQEWTRYIQSVIYRVNEFMEYIEIIFDCYFLLLISKISNITEKC